jgi:hypothetical protein
MLVFAPTVRELERESEFRETLQVGPRPRLPRADDTFTTSPRLLVFLKAPETPFDAKLTCAARGSLDWYKAHVFTSNLCI